MNSARAARRALAGTLAARAWGLGAACGGEPATRDTAVAAAPPAPPGIPDPAQNTYAPALAVDLAKFTKSASGVLYQDVEPGFGLVAEPGKQVSVHYAGWLPDGTKFDSSHDRQAPIEFMLGAGQVIRGWDEGLVGMKGGGRRKLVIPAELGYGAAGMPPAIPPNSVLVFDVQLMSVM